ncbi:putative glycolipid transfer protein [Cryptosporidium canis]|uniref:Glycolipid transfer protein n=1 Tax=Cryptosporidium canis TaxID=195482 RepID=A0ABQ8P524_9CRYT|nr:putative glycolipid transfer protein [Cryptosporidium canis]
MSGVEVCKEQEENDRFIVQMQNSKLSGYPKVERIITAFRNSTTYTESPTRTPVPLFEQFCRTAVLYSEFYQSVLGDNYVCKILQNDIINNSSRAMEAWRRESPGSRSVEDFLKSQIQLHTLDKIQSNQNSAVIKFLWTVRATNFIQCFIENLISSPKEDLYSSARDAYNKSLKPYHGFVKSGIAVMAFKTIRPKTEIVLSLGFPDFASAQEALRRLLFVSKPCIDQINILLEKHNCNFQHKV